MSENNSQATETSAATEQVSEHLVEVHDLKTYFHTAAGVAKAIALTALPQGRNH